MTESIRMINAKRIICMAAVLLLAVFLSCCGSGTDPDDNGAVNEAALVDHLSGTM